MISNLLDSSKFKAGQNLPYKYKEDDLNLIVREVAKEPICSLAANIIVK
jgi:hypothetical protein